MPVIPILLNDTARQVEYKIQVATARAFLKLADAGLMRRSRRAA
jgi:hypothetical protein